MGVLSSFDRLRSLAFVALSLEDELSADAQLEQHGTDACQVVCHRMAPGETRVAFPLPAAAAEDDIAHMQEGRLEFRVTAC
jgi:hypothetical protein